MAVYNLESNWRQLIDGHRFLFFGISSAKQYRLVCIFRTPSARSLEERWMNVGWTKWNSVTENPWQLRLGVITKPTKHHSICSVLSLHPWLDPTCWRLTFAEIDDGQSTFAVRSKIMIRSRLDLQNLSSGGRSPITACQWQRLHFF